MKQTPALDIVRHRQQHRRGHHHQPFVDLRLSPKRDRGSKEACKHDHVGDRGEEQPRGIPFRGEAIGRATHPREQPHDDEQDAVADADASEVEGGRWSSWRFP
jgi:hypothetical protein